MKLPIARPAPAPRPIARPTVQAFPVRPIIAPKPAARGAIMAPQKAGKVPPAIAEAALTAEKNRLLQNASKKAYDAARATLTGFLNTSLTKYFTVQGEINGEQKIVTVSLENTARDKISIPALMRASGLTLEELFDLDIFSTTKEAVVLALGARVAADATVAGEASYNAKIKSI